MHNGQPLGTPTTIVPIGKNFDNFHEAAVDSFKDKQNIIDVLYLSYDSNDIVAMITLGEVFNGTGYTDNERISPYVFSGTNLYTKGKYGSDHN